MPVEYNMTTTGTLSPVIVGDLGGLTFTHPTTIDLTTLAPEEDVIQSIQYGDLKDLLVAGHITILNQHGQVIDENTSDGPGGTPDGGLPSGGAKHVEDIVGNNILNAFNITHGFNTTSPSVKIWELDGSDNPKEEIETSVFFVSPNTIEIGFTYPPKPTEKHRIIVKV